MATKSDAKPNMSEDPQCSGSRELSNRAKKAQKRFQQKERYKEMKRRKKGLTKNESPGFDLFNDTEYYFENGLRKVYPYYHSFTTYAKGRWFNRTILNVLETEFLAETREVYQKAIEDGQITVNGKKVSPDYELQQHDLLENRLHRHENPVVGSPIEIIEDNNDVIVINKPASIPCHPCGRYRYNSLPFILGKEMDYKNLRTVYRLDRLTSGVLIFAKNAKSTRKLEDDIAARRVEKEYVCRVEGEFPEEEITCDQPLDRLSWKIGLQKVTPEGKQSKTIFRRMSYNGCSSVVKCIPKTGRTHQIRVHLQYLGHPILNDPMYNSTAYGPEKGKGGIFNKSDIEIFDIITKEHNVGLWFKEEGVSEAYVKRMDELKHQRQKSESQVSNKCPEVTSESHDTSEPKSKKFRSGDNEKLGKLENSDCSVLGMGDNKMCSVENISILEKTENMKSDSSVQDGEIDQPDGTVTNQSDTGQGHCLTDGNMDLHVLNRPGFEWNKWFPDEACSSCKKKWIDPGPEDLIIYLHALKYKGPDWEYETPLPDWAKAEWTEPIKEVK